MKYKCVTVLLADLDLFQRVIEPSTMTGQNQKRQFPESGKKACIRRNSMIPNL